MDKQVIQSALEHFDKIVVRARAALRQIEDDKFGYETYETSGFYVNAEGALKEFLQDLYEAMLVALEAGGMPETRATLTKNWEEFSAKEGGIGATVDDDEDQSTHSLPLYFIERMIRSLRACVDKQMSNVAAVELELLEHMLRSTAFLVHRRKDAPSKESELQKIMHDYLSACFVDFTKKPQINGRLKNFNPDCGILGIGAAVEFKIVRNREDIALAVSGVMEDIGGYNGSKDWTRFYSVLYQAHPFTTEAHVRKDLNRAGGTAWTPILVNGPMKKRKNAKAGSDPGMKGRSKERRHKQSRGMIAVSKHLATMEGQISLSGFGNVTGQ